MSGDAMILVEALRKPGSVLRLDSKGWTALLTIARAEQLLGTLSARLEGQTVPAAVNAILGDARANAAYQRRAALWEANRAAAALQDYPGKVVLMKGTAYHAAGLKAAEGRHVGDLDLMVAQEDLPQVEAALLAAGWEWVKEDAYDDAYYRNHMHELPPLIHKERDRMADVHHTILPLTARPKPDAAVMLSDAEPTEGGLHILSSLDRLVHCAAHLIADGELDGGLRNLWDFHCLMEELYAAAMDGNEPPDPHWVYGETEGALYQRARLHGLDAEVRRAVRLAEYCYGPSRAKLSLSDRLFLARMTARNGRGQGTRKGLRFAFYLRSHLLRMPPAMLARHLWTKWRKGHRG